MNILSIQSHVAYGHVGNSAAVFPLQRLGIEVWPVHTVQFAAHVGYGPPKGRVFEAQAISDVIDGIEQRGVLGQCSGVISGYIGSPEIGGAILDAVARVKRANPKALYCCDPVIGDQDGGAYVARGVAEFFREKALPTADVLTPNQFELELLSGHKTATLEKAVAAMTALRERGPRVVLATSIYTDATPRDHLDVLVSEARTCFQVRTPRLQTRAHGTGDLIAALFFAHYLRTGDAGAAAALATSAVFGVIEKTAAAGAEELTLVAAQDELVAPRRVFAAERVRA